ncbi:hypothetical protein NCS56_01504500 [Fusarium sp. Ph1]|nr:hypothetical protein NCS56_01504500 [Fusarium sp. Ph1]
MTLLRPAPSTNVTAIMATSCNCTSFDYKGQILENCRSIYSPDSQFSILTRRDESDRLQAFVLKTENGEHSMILSAAAHDAQGAIKALHDKSASAVDRYIVCHGYIAPPPAPFFSLGLAWVAVTRDQKASTIPRMSSRPDPQRMTQTAA